MVLVQHPCALSCLKQRFESYSCWCVFILSPERNPAGSYTSTHAVQDPQRASSRFVAGKEKLIVLISSNLL